MRYLCSDSLSFLWHFTAWPTWSKLPIFFTFFSFSFFKIYTIFCISLLLKSSAKVILKVVNFTRIFLFLFFNWRIFALQCCATFCWTTMWISCKYAYIPSFLSLPPTHSQPHPLSLLKHFFHRGHRRGMNVLMKTDCVVILSRMGWCGNIGAKYRSREMQTAPSQGIPTGQVLPMPMSNRTKIF